MWVINPAVGCHYFSPGLQLHLQPLRGLLPYFAAWWRGTMGVNSLPKLLPDSVVTAIWTRAFCAWVQHSNHSATEPPERMRTRNSVVACTACRHCRPSVRPAVNFTDPFVSDSSLRQLCRFCHFYRAMLCIRGTGHGPAVCPSVRVCVCVCVHCSWSCA